jgi:glyoxylase I family protein
MTPRSRYQLAAVARPLDTRSVQAEIDHVVLWVEDPLRAVAFYRDVVGFEALRVAEYEAKSVPFPSVRVSPRSVIDFAPRRMAAPVNGMARKAGLTNDAAGHCLNHLCLAMSRGDFDALRARLRAAGVDSSFTLTDAFGARGKAPDTFYFADPDGNVVEARYYDEPAADSAAG